LHNNLGVMIYIGGTLWYFT